MDGMDGWMDGLTVKIDGCILYQALNMLQRAFNSYEIAKYWISFQTIAALVLLSIKHEMALDNCVRGMEGGRDSGVDLF